MPILVLSPRRASVSDPELMGTLAHLFIGLLIAGGDPLDRFFGHAELTGAVQVCSYGSTLNRLAASLGRRRHRRWLRVLSRATGPVRRVRLRTHRQQELPATRFVIESPLGLPGFHMPRHEHAPTYPPSLTCGTCSSARPKHTGASTSLPKGRARSALAGPPC